MPAIVSANFTRPSDTTAYTIADLVANSTTAGSVTPLTFSTAKMIGQGYIQSVRLQKSNNTATNANFTLHLFTAAPTVTNGDNGAFAIDTALNHIGTVACDMTTGGVSGTAGLSKVFSITNGLMFDLTVGSTPQNRKLYGLLVAAAAYTPASAEVFYATLGIMNGY